MTSKDAQWILNERRTLRIPERAFGDLNRRLFDENRRMRALPAAELAKIPNDHLVAWAAEQSRYGLPSAELVDWLRTQIAGRSAIEIGAGTGDLGRLVGIPMTDSYVQARPKMKFLFDSFGERAIHPPSDVLKLAGLTAVQRMRPKVVVASWVTQLYRPGDTKQRIGSFAYGVDELALLKLVETYICIGNEITHRHKRILQKPHSTYHFPWLFSRASEPEFKVIWVWGPHPAGAR
jgi:hypothetical protein